MTTPRHSEILRLAAVALLFMFVQGEIVFPEKLNSGLKYAINIQQTIQLEEYQDMDFSRPNISMTAKDGRRYTCFLPPPSEDELQGSKEPTKTPKPKKAVPYSKVLKKLADKCFVLKKDFWDYEVCPFRLVKQYHLEGRKASPVFNLGVYDPDGDVEWEGTYTQSFKGGTGKRKATVVFRCSDGDPDHRVVAVDEPAPMSYTIEFQTPLMCQGPPSQRPPRPPSQLLDRLRTACLLRNEGWWTYEFCYLRHVVQFHEEGGQRVAEYLLGKYDMNANRELEAKGQNIIAAQTPYYFQIYNNGTGCEPLSAENRSVEVRFECNHARPVNYIRSLEEVATCRYVLHVVSPFVCAHDAFKAKQEPTKQIFCVPESALLDVHAQIEANPDLVAAYHDSDVDGEDMSSTGASKTSKSESKSSKTEQNKASKTETKTSKSDSKTSKLAAKQTESKPAAKKTEGTPAAKKVESTPAKTKPKATVSASSKKAKPKKS